MRKTTSLIALLIAAVLMAACGRRSSKTALLARADSLMSTLPDTAYRLLDSIQDEARTSWRRADRMRYELTLAEAMNKAYKDFITDSVMKLVVRYYDRHGSANLQLKARYLLGCAYRDMGEAPAAINAWQEAVDCADTTSTDCDYRTLSCIFSQMAELFHSELSLHDAIESRSKAIYYSYRATDTLNAIYDFARLAATYVLLNNHGKAEDVLLQVRDYYMRHNMVKEWARESVPLIYMYLRMPERLHDAKELIDAFETESGLMADGTMLSQVEFLLFKFKGQYYEQLNMLDSAEAFFRKLQHPRMEWTQKDPMYHGLTNIFRKRNIPDSVAKYALLYGEANDSSIAIKDRELITKMAALFNYSRVQDFAVKKELEAERNHSNLIVILSVSALLLSLLLSLSFSLWKRRVQLKKEHNRLLEEYVTTKLQHEKRLDEQQQIIRLKEKNIQSLDRASARLKMELYTKGEQYHQALLQIKETKAEYETYTNNLKAEIQRLNMKLDELKEQDYLKVCMEKAMLFRSKAIVQKVERIAREQTGVIEDNDWDMLSRVFTESYPKLMKDLRDASKIHRREIRVCMLTALGIAPSRIAALLGIKNNLVSRSKNYINMELFGDQDTASLFTNLELRYGLFS